MPTCIIHRVEYRDGVACPECFPAGDGESWFSWTCLVVGWLVSVLAAGLSLINMAIVLYALVIGEPELGVPPPFLPRTIVACIVSGVVEFLWFAGLAIVFSRSIRPARQGRRPSDRTDASHLGLGSDSCARPNRPVADAPSRLPAPCAGTHATHRLHARR